VTLPNPHFGHYTRIRLVGGQILASIPTPGDPSAWYDVNLNRRVNMRRRLNGIKRRALDLRAPFQAFRSIWYALTEQLFAAEGAIEGAQPWPALSPAYAAEKHDVLSPYAGMPILQRTQALIESLTGGPGGVYEAGPRSLQYGSTLDRFDYHMEGTENMPARPPVVLTRSAFYQLNRMVMAHVTNGTEGEGG